jgi:hypothetical protein
MRADDVCRAFSDTDAKVSLRLLEDDLMLIEGNSNGLKLLGNLLLSLAEAPLDDGFQIFPNGPGSIFFRKDATHGVYIHLDDDGSTNK